MDTTDSNSNTTGTYDVNISGQSIGLAIGYLNPFGKDKKAKKNIW